MKFASAINFDRNSGERSGGICGAPFPQTKAPRVSSQIQPIQFCSLGAQPRDDKPGELRFHKVLLLGGVEPNCLKTNLDKTG